MCYLILMPEAEEQKYDFPKVAPGEFIPTILALLLAIALAALWDLYVLAALTVLSGLVIQLILVAYRLMSGVIMIIQIFAPTAAAVPRIHQLLDGILRPGLPGKGS